MISFSPSLIFVLSCHCKSLHIQSHDCELPSAASLSDSVRLSLHHGNQGAELEGFIHSFFNNTQVNVTSHQIFTLCLWFNLICKRNEKCARKVPAEIFPSNLIFVSKNVTSLQRRTLKTQST